MADKPEFVDLISEATRQTRRRYMPRVEEPRSRKRRASAIGPRTAGRSGGWRR